MSIKNLEKAINNLNSLSRLIVPTATAKALNRVGQATIRQGSRKVAKEAVVGDGKKKGIPVKLVRQRARLKKANPQRLSAGIKINRGNLPAIKLGAAQTRLSRRKNNKEGRGSYLKIGPYRFRNAFIQQLANGRWQVMQRASGSQYPISVAKVPLAKPLTVNFWKISRQLINSDMSKELSYALKNQLRIHLTR
ncbi:phage tail protein [Klebsiella sp. PL-2018]|uniref:phage tail protein n=1 Tax=Klebsiella sp. PL-2018 TaxID=2851540 RepID=UPI001C212605|nr:phage tail protein [Klebsiella sp. PL-2018]QXC99321.1 Phage tail assembly [Klebsiella sp. PL-2018]